jgi:hypothetical protein
MIHTGTGRMTAMSTIGGIEIKGNETIGRALAANDLEVPVNQRSYRWEEKHIKELFDDLATAIDLGDNEYFLGSIVVIKNDEGRPQVVDGQQRLATTMILLAAIRDYFYKDGQKERAQSIENDYLMKLSLRTEEKEPKLVLSDTDRDYFQKRMLLRPGDQDRVAMEKLKPSEIRKPSHKNLNVAAITASKRVQAIASSGGNANTRLLDWVEFIRDGARVIWVIAPNDSNAFIMFETLNDRGLELSKSDLVKNYLFGRSGSRISEAQDRWLKMIGSLETVDSEEITLTYIRHQWSSRYGLSREKELYAKIKDKVKSKQNAVDFCSEIAEDAIVYAALLNMEQPFWEPHTDATKEALRVLLELRMEQVRPLLLSIAKSLNKKEVERSFRLLVNCSVRFFIVGGLGGGTMERHYSAQAGAVRRGEIKSAKELLKKLEKAVPGDSAFQTAFATARVSQAHLARYYLRALENQIKSGSEWTPTIDKETIDLEHILDQSTQANLDPDTYQDYYKRLGNLALLESQINAKMGTEKLAFSKKRPYYRGSEYNLTAVVGQGSDKWGPDEIDSRQQHMAELAVKTWPLKT